MSGVSCTHCEGECRGSDLKATYSRSKWNNRLGCLIALPISSNHKYLHQTCLKFSLDEFIKRDTLLWQSPEPKNCAVCRVDIVGDLIWKIEKVNGDTPKYPFTYICSACGDVHVFGE